jgi:hypothetical protein
MAPLSTKTSISADSITVCHILQEIPVLAARVSVWKPDSLKSRDSRDRVGSVWRLDLNRERGSAGKTLGRELRTPSHLWLGVPELCSD